MIGILPSRRLLALFALAAPLFLLHGGVALGVDALLLLAALVDAILAPGRERLWIDRRAPAKLSLGTVGDVWITIRNASRRRLRLRLTDDLPAALVRIGDEVHEREVRPGELASLGYQVRADARGPARIGPIYVRILGPLGLVWLQYRQLREDTVRVQPGILEVRRYRLSGLRDRLRELGLRNVRERGEGGSFESLRTYVRGDDPRTIDWKATARHDELMVRNYEAERSQNVMIAIDAGRLMTERIGGRERIDYALAAALLLAEVASKNGDRIGLLVFSDEVEQYLPPARAPLSRIADVLGDVRPRLVESNYPEAFAHLARQLRRRSLLVLFTDLIDAQASSALIAHLTHATTRHLPLAVTLRNPDLEAIAAGIVADEAGAYRRAAAEELLQARAEALTTMQRARILVADTAPDVAVPTVVNRYLDVKRRGLL